MVISLCLKVVVDSINSIPLEDNTGIIRPNSPADPPGSAGFFVMQILHTD